MTFPQSSRFTVNWIHITLASLRSTFKTSRVTSGRTSRLLLSPEHDTHGVKAVLTASDAGAAQTFEVRVKIAPNLGMQFTHAPRLKKSPAVIAIPGKHWTSFLSPVISFRFSDLASETNSQSYAEQPLSLASVNTSMELTEYSLSISCLSACACISMAVFRSTMFFLT